MKNMAILMGLMFALMGCRDISGTLNVPLPLDIYYKGNLKMELTPGQYDAEIKIKQKRRTTKVRLRVDAEDGDRQTLRFRTKERIDIPSNGSFSISSEQSNLNIDIFGEVTTEETYQGRHSDREQCTYQERVRRCEIIDTPSGPTRRCFWEWRDRDGWRNVTFELYRTDRNLSFIIPNGDEDIPSEFSGDDHWYRRVYLFEGQCDRF